MYPKLITIVIEKNRVEVNLTEYCLDTDLRHGVAGGCKHARRADAIDFMMVASHFSSRYRTQFFFYMNLYKL